MSNNISDQEITSNDGFKSRLRLLAQRAGNPTALAAMCGLRQSSMRGFLRVGNPPRTCLLRIARGAKVRLVWLLYGVGPMEVDLDMFSSSESSGAKD